MKITNTGFKMKVNNSSSFIVYVCKDFETAQNVAAMANTMTPNSKGWYSSIRFHKVERSCFVPEFFHNKDYWVACVEHNRGDWDLEPTYDLYIVE